MRVDVGLGTEHAHGQRFRRHLQREDADHGFAFDGRMLRECQRQTRFTHRRPRGDHDKVLLLQARSQRIERAKSRSDASYHQVAVLNRLGLFQHALGGVLDVLEMLGMIENVLRLVFFFQRLAGDLVCDFDELPQKGFSAHDFRVLHDAVYVRQPIGQIRKENYTTD